MKRLIPILAALVILGGCEQDPLKDASSAVRNGHLPGHNETKPAKPLDKEALQVDGPALVNARVNFPVEVKLSGRVLVPDVPFKVLVENMEKFPGATFDEATGIFKWTPSKDFMAGQLAVQETLKVVLRTEPGVKNYPVAVENKSISVVVVNTYSRPIVNSLVIEKAIAGKVTPITFAIEDQDAINANDLSLIPTECEAGSSQTPSLAGLVTFDHKSLSAGAKPGQYTGTLNLDLSRVDYLPSRYNYCFAIQVVSKFGVASIPYEQKVEVTPKVFVTKSTLPSLVEVAAGDVLKLGFSFYDPSGTGSVSIWDQQDLGATLPGSMVVCQSRYSMSYVDCYATINARTANPGQYSAEFQVKNTVSGTADIQKHTLRIQVRY